MVDIDYFTDIKISEIYYEEVRKQNNGRIYKKHMIEPTTVDIEASHPIENNTLKSCCFKLDKTSVKYFTQIGILSFIMIYSATMIVLVPDCNSQRNYSALLTMCLGVLLPSPKH